MPQLKNLRENSTLTSVEIIKRIASLFDEIYFESEEEIDEFLREEGYDPDEIGATMSEFAALLQEKYFNEER